MRIPGSRWSHFGYEWYLFFLTIKKCLDSFIRFRFGIKNLKTNWNVSFLHTSYWKRRTFSVELSFLQWPPPPTPLRLKYPQRNIAHDWRVRCRIDRSVVLESKVRVTSGVVSEVAWTFLPHFLSFYVISSMFLKLADRSTSPACAIKSSTHSDKDRNDWV